MTKDRNVSSIELATEEIRAYFAERDYCRLEYAHDILAADYPHLEALQLLCDLYHIESLATYEVA